MALEPPNETPRPERPLQLTLLDMIGGQSGDELRSGDPTPEPSRKRAPAKKRAPALEQPALEPVRREPVRREPLSEEAPPLEPAPKKPKVFTVTELVSELNRELSQRFANVWLEGELGRISFRKNIYYLSIKDERSLVDAVLMVWKFKPPFELKEGLKVRVRGYVDIYPPRGKLSFQINYMEPLGAGALALAFEQLKKKLQGEGLFDNVHKRPVPTFPRTVGVLTSTKSAAFRDMLKVSSQRVGTRIVAAEALVQGSSAPASIMAALKALMTFGQLDCIIIARGGGSPEDLAAFNDEALVRAIFACPIPIVTGIGHQIDFTLADFVADVRAATPTEAAEKVFVEHRLVEGRLRELSARVAKAASHKLEIKRNLLLRHSGRIVTPQAYLDRRGRHLDQVTIALERATQRLLDVHARRLEVLSQKLDGRALLERTAQGRDGIALAKERLMTSLREQLHLRRQRLGELRSTLKALDPLAVLERGYAVVTTKDGAVVRSAGALLRGEAIEVRLKNGAIGARVEEIHD